MRTATTKSNTRYIRQRKRKTASFFALWIILVLSVSVSAYYFANSVYFSVGQVFVYGNEVVSAEEIVEMTDLKFGANIFRVSTVQAVQKVLVHPRIKSLSINRKLPDTLKVTVVERKPLALVICDDGIIMVDEDRVYLEKTSDILHLNYPLISGVTVPNDARPGDVVETPGLVSAIRLITLMDKEFFSNVIEISAETSQSLSLKTKQGVVVMFGEPEDLERKVEVMESLLLDNSNAINNQTVEYLDLRYKTAPVIKRKNSK